MHEAAHLLVPMILFFVVFLALLLSFLAYLIPAFVAHACGHPRRLWISVINVLVGWSLVGWLVCLIWALSGERKQTVCRCTADHCCGLEDCDTDEVEGENTAKPQANPL